MQCSHAQAVLGTLLHPSIPGDLAPHQLISSTLHCPRSSSDIKVNFLFPFQSEIIGQKEAPNEAPGMNRKPELISSQQL